MFTKMLTTKINHGVVRHHLNQNSCGLMTLQLIMIQYAHQYGPNARFLKAYSSYGLPPYQAMKNSMPYA